MAAKMGSGLTPYKVVVFGSGGVGKSSITLRFVTDTFNSDYLPTIEDCYRKNCLVDGKAAHLDILDTAGQEEYSALRDQWVREGRAFLLVYSCTSRQTFEEIPSFRERILMVNEDAAVPMVLVSNKCDAESERKVSKEEGQRLAAEYGTPGSPIPFIECSALKAINCDRVFHEAVREIRKMDESDEKSGGGGGRSGGKEPGFFSWCSIL